MGSLLLAVALPVLLIVAAVSAVSLRAWPFFVQNRVGLDGEVFRFVKIRTLPRSTPAYATKYELDRIVVPRVAAQLRRLHFDELPQLALVVTGKMSLVGPRPEMPQLHAALERDVAVARTAVKPGCTGLWQIGEHCTGLIAEAPEYDSFYLRHRSQRLDLWILARTLGHVVSLGGPVTIEDVPDWAVSPSGRASGTAVRDLVGSPRQS